MASQKYTNLAQGALASAYTVGDTSLVLGSSQGASFPSAGDFTVAVDEPTAFLLKCTSRSTDTLTVDAAAAEGTTRSNKAIGIKVSQVVTAGVLDSIRSDQSRVGAYASLPVLGMRAGDVYRCTDSPYELVYDGSLWQCFLPGIGNVKIPPTTGWVYTNQSSATLDSSLGVLIWSLPNSGGSDRYILRTPSYATPPWSVVCGLTIYGMNVNYFDHGLMVRNSSNGKVVWCGLATGTVRASAGGISADTVGPGTLTSGGGIPLRFKITNDGTNIRVYVSYTCYSASWLLMTTYATATLGTIDGVGLVADKLSNTAGVASVDVVTMWDFEEYNSVV